LARRAPEEGAPRSHATRANAGQRVSRSVALHAAPNRPPHFTQRSRARSAPASAAEEGSKASRASTIATCPPSLVTRLIKAVSKLLLPEDPGPTISLSFPGRNALSKRSTP